LRKLLKDVLQENKEGKPKKEKDVKSRKHLKSNPGKERAVLTEGKSQNSICPAVLDSNWSSPKKDVIVVSNRRC
jgi:hypothetical protein